MGDNYKHIPEGVSSIITNLKTILEDYKDRIVELETLVNEINGSTDWKDASVKTSFINTCNSYITIYKNLATIMEKYISYLTGKSDTATALERAYSG